MEWPCTFLQRSNRIFFFCVFLSLLPGVCKHTELGGSAVFSFDPQELFCLAEENPKTCSLGLGSQKAMSVSGADKDW